MAPRGQGEGEVRLTVDLPTPPLPLAMVTTRIADTPAVARSHATWTLRAGGLQVETA
jgi:hypothetical protein